jgi:hypothetical protein
MGRQYSSGIKNACAIFLLAFSSGVERASFYPYAEAHHLFLWLNRGIHQSD